MPLLAVCIVILCDLSEKTFLILAKVIQAFAILAHDITTKHVLCRVQMCKDCKGLYDFRKDPLVWRLKFTTLFS